MYNLISFLKGHYLYLISITGMLFFIFISNTLLIINTNKHFIVNQKNDTFFDNTNINVEALCAIIECSYVIQNGLYSYAKEINGITKLVQDVSNSQDISDGQEVYKLLDGVYLSNFNILLEQKSTGSLYAINLLDNFIKSKNIYFFTFGFAYFIIFIHLYLLYRKEKHQNLLSNISATAVLSNQSMVVITENVHHELNTPLEVIHNKILKVDNKIQKLTTCKNVTPEKIEDFIKVFKSLTSDFDYIYLSLEQTHAILDKMKSFKHIKYSNGNKTLYDIVENACQIISISNSGFEYTICDELKHYRMKYNKSQTLKNIDLLSVLINHLKNSIEANATFVSFEVQEPPKFILKIVDDGGGIPKELVNKLFSANTSSKNTDSSARGNGMYLNKYILNSCGADEKILDTSENGTTIGIEIKVIPVE